MQALRQRSMQKCKPPSFFLTNTTALHHALWLGHMAPDSSISLRWLWTSSTKGGGICLNHSLKGVSSVILIMCSVEWVQPNSAGSNEKTLWYSAKSCQAESAISGGHNSNPLRFSSSNSFPCLCLTVNLVVWGLWDFFSLFESLGVGHTIPHHHDCIIATFPQFGVCILHHETMQ